MKITVKIFGIVFLLLVIISCSDDDGDTESPSEFVGTWDLTEVNVSSSLDLDGDGTSSTNILDETDCITGTFIFNEDSTYQYQQSSFRITLITNGSHYVSCYGDNLATGVWTSNGSEVAFQANSLLTGTLQLDGNRIIKRENQELPGVITYVYERR